MDTSQIDLTYLFKTQVVNFSDFLQYSSQCPARNPQATGKTS